jgi:hypothetical protein
MWALLHYLDQQQRSCIVFELQSYLRGNWPSTKDLVERAIGGGWVMADERHREFSITAKGHDYLLDLRRVLEPLHADAMAPFRRRLGEAVDYPK